MGACKAPIPHLLITSSSSSSTQPPNLKALIPISRTPLPTRRLVLLSLPLATFLLPSKSIAIDAIDSSSSSPSSSSFNPISEAERDASAAISQRISEALELLEKGRELQARGDFGQALLCFTQVPTLSLKSLYVQNLFFFTLDTWVLDYWVIIMRPFFLLLN